jgi:ABC-type transport system involved in multi-copper enzyme maturation permease subunit
MIWLTWRQFRPQAITAAAGLIVMAIVLAVTGRGVGSAYTSSRLPTCHVGCATIASNFINSIGRSDHFLYFGGILLMYLVPALMGLFWGAPLIAREFEAGTHRIAWNQTVTRTRWTFVKLGLAGLAAIATAGLLSLMVTWWASPIDHAASLAGGSVQVAAGAATGVHSTWFVETWLEPAIFAARGVAPLGYAAFAFALSVTAGVLLRRTLPAMAVTLAVFAVIQVMMPNLVRPHLLPPAHFTAPLEPQSASLHETASAPTGQVTGIDLTALFAKPGAWVLSDVVITPSGAQAPGTIVTPYGVDFTVLPKACLPAPGSGSPSAVDCRSALAAMHLRQSVTYQPASRFWPLQWIETGIYLVLAAGLGWACVWQVRRRRAA